MKKYGEKKGITFDTERKIRVEGLRSKGRKEKRVLAEERRPREDKIGRGDCSALRSVESATVGISSGIS